MITSAFLWQPTWLNFIQSGASPSRMQWKRFLEGHWFTTSNGNGTFEVDTKKLGLTAFINGTPKLCKEQCHFIWIVIINNYSPRKIEMQKHSDGRMIINPPLNCILDQTTIIQTMYGAV
jgi:hypothetical protein